MPLIVASESKREPKPGVKAGRAEKAEAKTRRKIKEDARKGESHEWRAQKKESGRPERRESCKRRKSQEAPL